MQVKCLDPEQFEAKKNTVVRFWNDLEQRAQAHNQANQELKDSCKYIFVRDDGWSIASPDAEAAYQLWPQEWSWLYILNGDEPTRNPENFIDGAFQFVENKPSISADDMDRLAERGKARHETKQQLKQRKN